MANKAPAKVGKSLAERQEDLRARRAIEGMREVRGLYLPLEMHDVFKARARALLSRNVAQRARRARMKQAQAVAP